MDGVISGEGSTAQIGTQNNSVGYTAEKQRENKRKRVWEESEPESTANIKENCSDDNYGNRSIFVFENIFIIKVLAYFKLFFLISYLQMYTKKIKS